MLDPKTFQTIVENTPLVSIDICLVCGDEMLMCKRNFAPLMGQWFTPGGRIFKNESMEEAFLRICKTELGMLEINMRDFSLIGAWDNFYNNSFFDEDISTHYVNLPHYVKLNSKPEVILDNQHSDFEWFELIDIANNEEFHSYMQNYTKSILELIKTKEHHYD
jgi:colanic acid biosynthesis protein WcaH|tara:strand:- start:2548 stop:3036 length:489 start_codon:yes stop_codon:yes gene_type:complete